MWDMWKASWKTASWLTKVRVSVAVALCLLLLAGMLLFVSMQQGWLTALAAMAIGLWPASARISKWKREQQGDKDASTNRRKD